MAKQRFFMVFMSHIFRLRKLFFCEFEWNAIWIGFKSDLNRISITFISNARARNIKTKTKTKIFIIMIYFIMMMKEYLPKERFGMFAVFNFCLG